MSAPRISPTCSLDRSSQFDGRRDPGELCNRCARPVTNDGEGYRLDRCLLLHPRLQLPCHLPYGGVDVLESGDCVFALGAVGRGEDHEPVGKVEPCQINQRMTTAHRPGPPSADGKRDNDQEHNRAEPDERVIQRRPQQ